MIQPKIGCVAVIVHVKISLNSAVIVLTKPSTFFTAASASPFEAWLPGGDCLIEIRLWRTCRRLSPVLGSRQDTKKPSL